MFFCQALLFSSCLDDKSSCLQRAQTALLDGPPPEDGGAWVTNISPTASAPPSTDAMSRFFGRSFSGTDSVGGEPLFCWITRHYDGLSMEAKEELIRFVLSVEVHKGGMLVAKQLPVLYDGADRSPSYSAMSLIRLYDTADESSWHKKKLNSITEAFLFMRQGFAYGFPSAMQDKRWKETGEGTMKVLDLMGKEFDSQHQTIMHDTCHWYINLLGTDPSQQGRGQGSQLVRRISELADERGMDCYLEANGEDNRRFYEKFGFRCKGSAVFRPPDQWTSASPVAGEHDTVTTYFMERKADVKSA